MRKLTAALLLAAVAAPIALAGGSSAGTTLTIVASRINPDNEVPAQFDMNGKVKSARERCTRNRTVRVFRQVAGPNRLEGSDRSNDNGNWFVAGEVPGPSANGTYYAKAPAARRGDLRCRGDRSPNHVIDFDARLASARGGGDADGIPSAIEIDNYHAEDDEAVFSGEVTSPRRRCERGRKVTVFGHDEKGTPPETVLGRDRTGRRGRFEVRRQIPFFNASYAYAKTKRKRLANGRVCKAARSEEISTAG